jgi:DNA-binding NarL/FixJ family response regulator
MPHWTGEVNPLTLGPRERDVLRVLLTGADNLEISRELGMAPRTVKAHFNRLFMKFGISDGVKRVKLVVIVHRQRKELFGYE